MKKQKRRFYYLLTGVIFFLALGKANGQATNSYIFRLGNDTVALEQYTRGKDMVEGNILSLYPRLMVTHFKATLGTDGTINKLESGNYYPSFGQAPVPGMDRLCIINDTLATQEFKRNGKTDTLFSGTFKVKPGAVPSLDYDVAMFEQMLLQAAATGKDSVAYQRYTNGPMNSYIKKIKENEYESKVFFFPILIKTDDKNKIISLDATGTTVKTIATPASAFDFNKLMSVYAEQEKRKGTTGQLSPSDTVKTSFKGADFQLTYGRPSKRGRVIFGNVVPWNRVWRLGGNYATHFSTSKDLQFGDSTLPAGRYTIWILPNKDRYELIINKAVNIFGTQYNKKNDLMRLPMTFSGLSSPVEKLTISVNETKDGGDITVQWDLLKTTIAFKLK